MESNSKKNIIYSIILLLVIVVVYLYRKNTQQSDTISANTLAKVVVSGNTMGTTYRVVYLDDEKRDFKIEIDSILVVFNQSLSTYIPDSELSRFNKGDSLVFELPYFYPVLAASKIIYEKTDGAFDPTVGPLVNLWGFGPTGPQLQDSVNIDQQLKLVNFSNIQFDKLKVNKKDSRMYLDFSAIAKGYGVDVVAEFLNQQGIENYLVEIGGELVAKGVNENGEIWKVGINKPEEGDNDIVSIVALNNQALATSGNYRNFYEVEGQKFSHTINPATGRPVRHGLLSATVIAKDCMTADAYATALMVMGTDNAIALQEREKDFEIFLIYNDEAGAIKTFASEGIKPFLSFPQEN
jgi:thiamine biosynthesis lipoprotein